LNYSYLLLDSGFKNLNDLSLHIFIFICRCVLYGDKVIIVATSVDKACNII